MGLDHVLHPLILFRPIRDLPNYIARCAQEKQSGYVKVKNLLEHPRLPNIDRLGPRLNQKLPIKPLFGFLPQRYSRLLHFLTFYKPVKGIKI